MATDVLAEVLRQIDVPVRAQPGLVCVVASIPSCDRHSDRPGVFDFASRYGFWMHGCPECYLMLRVSDKLGLGTGQVWVTREQLGSEVPF